MPKIKNQKPNAIQPKNSILGTKFYVNVNFFQIAKQFSKNSLCTVIGM